jgi:hypothetical protein
MEAFPPASSAGIPKSLPKLNKFLKYFFYFALYEQKRVMRTGSTMPPKSFLLFINVLAAPYRYYLHCIVFMPVRNLFPANVLVALVPMNIPALFVKIVRLMVS